MQTKENIFKIIVKANSTKNKIIRYDSNKEAYKINIKAKAEDNKANTEIIKFLSRLLKKKVKIIKGLKSKEKIIKVIDKK